MRLVGGDGLCGMQASHLHKATFGGGCFWGPELLFQRVPGVVATEVGYAQVRPPSRGILVCSMRARHCCGQYLRVSSPISPPGRLEGT